MEPIQLIIFGASGDLSQRKLLPALFNLEVKGKLPDDLVIIGASRRPWRDEDFQSEVKGFLQEFAKESFEKNAQIWDKFAQRLKFSTVEFDNLEHYAWLKKRLEDMDAKQNRKSRKILYYSVSPEFFEEITRNVGESMLLGDKESCSLCRVVVEKPFGNDLESSKNLSDMLGSVFSSEQIYRIDHVLSKNALADILSFRKNNFAFNGLFSNKYVDHIQVTYAEKIGIGRRGSFYEQNGAIRDMVQSHILEALSLVMAEMPDKITAEDLHKNRASVISSMDFQGPDDMVVGQYEGYKQEENVAYDSQVETYVALRLLSNLENWQGVPIYLRTGKQLRDSFFDIHLVFKDDANSPQDKKNILSFRISPNSGINWRLWKNDLLGHGTNMDSIDLTHCYHPDHVPDAYENLLVEIFRGNKLFFVSLDEIFASWKLIDKVKQVQSNSQIHSYKEGTNGPDAAKELVDRDSREWFEDNISDFCKI